jgi:pilus assembly protein CpaB
MALVVSLVVSWFLYNRIKREYAARVQPIKLVAATKPLDAGATITADAVTLVDWPVNFPVEGAMKNTQDAVGRMVMFPIAAKEPVREALLAAPGAVGLTAKIPDGMRAVAVETNDVTNVSGFLFPGCRVDVLVTFRPENARADTEDLTATVLQNVEVLSTGERLQPDPSGKPQKVRQVTMLLNPDDAQKLVLAANKGAVQFVLRNGTDQAQEVRRPTQMKDLQTTTSAPTQVAVKRAPAPPKPPNFYEVETYDGNKKNTVKF